MKPEEKRWSEISPLTAPESYVLMYGPESGGSRPFKLALMELVAGKCLTLTDAEDRILSGLWKRNVALLAPGPKYRSPGSRSLSALLDLLDEMAPRTTRDGNTGVPVARFARKARRKYGWLGGYAESEVIPDLASRGFYERREQFGLWKVTRAGEAARAELERNLAAVGKERLSLWVDEDPTRALAFLGITGSSVLLTEEMHPGIQRLRERQHAEDGTYLHPGLEYDPDRGDPATDWPDVFDGLDLGTFDGLDDVFSAIDLGVGSGDGGSGGDGGGGGS